MVGKTSMQGATTLCNGIKQDGRRCTCPVVLASGFCFAHDPARREDADAGRRAGGRGRSNAARLQKNISPRVSAICDKLEPLIDQLRKGEVDPRVATAMASVARTMVQLESSAGVEERLRALESQMLGVQTED